MSHLFNQKQVHMKHKLILISAILIAGLAILFFICFPRVDAKFATSASLRYHYAGKSIDTKVTDSDLRDLKEILVGRSYPDSPACGFSADVAITLTDGNRSMTFCPACDTCSVIRIGNTNRYIGIRDDQRKRLDAILAKYSMIFPCV